MDVPSRSNTIVVIPSRMAAARLPGKPLADICGEPMIVHVWRRAVEAGTGPVLVAAAENQIATAVHAAGGDAIVTEPSLPSGSDRVWQALTLRDPAGRYKFVVNLQGDLPTIDPELIRTCLEPLKDPRVDIATLAAKITERAETCDPNVVKAIAALEDTSTFAIARDFVRNLPKVAIGPFWHHIGIYAYRREALQRFVNLPQSLRERDRKLEQMRAMDNGMTIAVARVDTTPLGVDTSADLERARILLNQPPQPGQTRTPELE